MTPGERDEWLKDWSFVGSPYGLISTMLHEGFHVHQHAQGDKFADESLIARYPLYDATNGALHLLEGLILLAAVRDETPPTEALRQFAAVRTARHAGLTPHPEMCFAAGFNGYSRLARRFDEQIAFAERLIRREVAVNNDRFGAGNFMERRFSDSAQSRRQQVSFLDRRRAAGFKRVYGGHGRWSKQRRVRKAWADLPLEYKPRSSGGLLQ